MPDTATPPPRPEPRAPAPRRSIPPLAYPLVAVLFGGALVFSFSRILLVVNKHIAAAIALLIALNILVGAALVAYGPRVRRRPASYPLLLGAGALLIAAGAVAATFGSHAPEPSNATAEARPNAHPVALTAKGLKFEQTKLTFSTGQVTVAFSNQDSGVPHNFVLFKGDDANAPIAFRGDPVTGPGTTRYTFQAPPPGTYFFHCEFHPTTMTGTATVTAGPAGQAAGGGAAAGALQLTGKGLKFTPTQLRASSGAGQITIHFVNQDAQIPHNVVVFKGRDENAPVLFRGDPVTGPSSADYTFAAPPAGTYFFHCEFHPTTMKGFLVVP